MVLSGTKGLGAPADALLQLSLELRVELGDEGGRQGGPRLGREVVQVLGRERVQHLRAHLGDRLDHGRRDVAGLFQLDALGLAGGLPHGRQG